MTSPRSSAAHSRDRAGSEAREGPDEQRTVTKSGRGSAARVAICRAFGRRNPARPRLDRRRASGGRTAGGRAHLLCGRSLVPSPAHRRLVRVQRRARQEGSRAQRRYAPHATGCRDRRAEHRGGVLGQRRVHARRGHGEARPLAWRVPERVRDVELREQHPGRLGGTPPGEHCAAPARVQRAHQRPHEPHVHAVSQSEVRTLCGQDLHAFQRGRQRVRAGLPHDVHEHGPGLQLGPRPGSILRLRRGHRHPSVGGRHVQCQRHRPERHADQQRHQRGIPGRGPPQRPGPGHHQAVRTGRPPARRVHLEQ